ncbi:MAG: type II toxin-antitoxin system HicA family toxin [Anaerolineae bacterium]|nr:type II toxin-antitoxin system HicA family toxin [Anaerolineae bacterium]
MPHLTPVSRRELIRRLIQLEFDGPYTGGRHEFMIRGNIRLVLPNPHRGNISVDLLRRLLRQAEITRDEWQTTEK